MDQYGRGGSFPVADYYSRGSEQYPDYHSVHQKLETENSALLN